jgi:hypothetical protein
VHYVLDVLAAVSALDLCTCHHHRFGVIGKRHVAEQHSLDLTVAPEERDLDRSLA